MTAQDVEVFANAIRKTVRYQQDNLRDWVRAYRKDAIEAANRLRELQNTDLNFIRLQQLRIAVRIYKFDVSETATLNVGAKIINVQWDFDYGKHFSSTPGFSFVRGRKKEPALQAQYEFPSTGTYRIACKAQDDMDGEGKWA